MAAAPTGQPPCAFSQLKRAAEHEPCVICLLRDSAAPWRRGGSYRSEVGDLLPDLRLEEQRLALGQPDQAVVILDHFGFDQITLAFDLQRHPRRRTQRTYIAHLRGVVIFQFMARQRHLVRTEQHMIVFAQVQTVRITEEVINEIAGRVFVDVTR
ncbi:hypothetical protein D3C73_898960 [compost metagenome]